MRWIETIVMGLALFSMGCSVKSTPPVTEYAIIGKSVGYDRLKDTHCRDASLKILEPFGSYEYSVNELHYVVLPYEENSYTQSAWVQPVSTMLYNEILKAIRESRIFATVSNYSSVAKGDYVLEIEINDFKQYFTPSQKRSYIVSDMTFTLVGGGDFLPVSQKVVYKKIKTKELNAKGGVEALNQAQQETIEEVVKWLEGTCKR